MEKIVINLLVNSTGTHLIIQITSNYGLFSNFFLLFNSKYSWKPIQFDS